MPSTSPRRDQGERTPCQRADNAAEDDDPAAEHQNTLRARFLRKRPSGDGEEDPDRGEHGHEPRARLGATFRSSPSAGRRMLGTLYWTMVIVVPMASSRMLKARYLSGREATPPPLACSFIFTPSIRMRPPSRRAHESGIGTFALGAGRAPQGILPYASGAGAAFGSKPLIAVAAFMASGRLMSSTM